MYIKLCCKGVPVVIPLWGVNTHFNARCPWGGVDAEGRVKLFVLIGDSS